MGDREGGDQRARFGSRQRMAHIPQKSEQAAYPDGYAQQVEKIRQHGQERLRFAGGVTL